MMRGRVVAVANMKGGVGKTATVIALAEALAKDDPKDRILVIDLDAQANASICLAGDSPLTKLIREQRTVDGYLKDYLFKKKDVDIGAYIRANASDVSHNGSQLDISLFAASPTLRLVEVDLIYKLTQNNYSLNKIVSNLSSLIGTQLREAKKQYGFIIVDCAPGISVLTEVIIRLVDFVIVPTIPDPLSTYGLQTFCGSIWRKPQSSSNPFRKKPQATLPYVLFTRRQSVKLQNLTVEKLRKQQSPSDPEYKIFHTEIPERVAIANALGMAGKSPSFHRKWGGVVDVMESLAHETKGVMNGASA